MTRRLLISLIAVLGILTGACGDSEPDIATAAPKTPTIQEATAAPVETPVAPTAVAPTAVAPTAVAPTPQPYDAPGALEVPFLLEEGLDSGTVIDTEQIEFAGGLGYRILYYSTSIDSDLLAPTAVSGFVAYPQGEPPAGGWPLIAWAHGTTGLGDSCAPSHDAENDQLAQALVALGYAVVATDFEGLGTPGTHPYVVGASEAHSVLDSVRAVHNMELPVTNEWIVFGHSQGGHAAMFTGQLQPTYAPELNLIGVVAGAPPSQLRELNQALIGGDFQGYLIMTAAGLVAAYDELDFDDVLSSQAIDLLDVVETGCTAEIFEVYNGLDYDTVTVVDDPFALPAWGESLASNDTNLLPIEVPLLIIHGGEDEQIPVGTSATLFDQLCAFETQGPTVRNVYPGESHSGVLTSGAAVPDFLAWVAARFANDPAPDDCPV